MSCDGNTAAHASNLAASPQIAAALGGGDPAAAKEAILHIHELATTRAERSLRDRGTPTGLAKIQARGADAAAAEATVAAFQEITASGLNVPAHGDAHPRYGVPLPKLATQYGWQAVQQTVEAVRGRQTLPAIAQEVLAGAQTTRRMTSIVEAGGKNHYRCGECGRYRSPTDHTCPMTANARALGRKLTRRLGVPGSAYPAGALDALIAQARQGDIVMRHGLTGEIVSVSLDSLPSALAGGFVPDTWRRERSLALAQMSNGRVVPVLDAQNLSVLPRQQTALGMIAAAYGSTIPTGAIVGGPVGVPVQRVQQVQQTATTSVAGGQVYDTGHFIGSEFRKSGSNGTAIRVGTMTYAVGQRSKDPAHFGSARDLSGNTAKTDEQAGKEPLPKGGSVAVGRTLMAAVGILHDGEVVETADGQIQIYTRERRSLLAVYDPKTNTAGDTAGSTNMSAEQMAAVMAYRALHPQNGFDVALAADLTALNSGTGNAWRASDAMYIAAKNGVFANGGQVSFGGQVGTQKCPTCGRFAGDAHACPGSAQLSSPAQPRGGVVVEDLPADLRPVGQPAIATPFEAVMQRPRLAGLVSDAESASPLELSDEDRAAVHALAASLVQDTSLAPGARDAAERVLADEQDSDRFARQLIIAARALQARQRRRNAATADESNTERAPSISLRPDAVFAPQANAVVAGAQGDYIVAVANHGLAAPQDGTVLDGAATAVLSGTGAPTDLADAANLWIAVRSGTANDPAITEAQAAAGFARELVAHGGAQQCPDCGQYMSLKTPHNCPNKVAAAAPVLVPVVAPFDQEALRTTIAEAMVAMPPVMLSPHVTVEAPQVTVENKIDTDALATALGNAVQQALSGAQPAAPGGMVQLDEEKLAAALRTGLPQQMTGTAQFDAEALANAIKAGMPQNVTAQFDAEALAAALQKGIASQQAPQVTVQLDTAALAEALKSMPAPVMDTSAFTAALQATLASVANGNVGAVAPVAQPVSTDGQPIAVAAQDPAVAQAMVQMAQAAARMSEVAERLAQGTPAAAPTAPATGSADTAQAAPAARAPRTGLIRPEGLPLTAQEHILSPVTLPAPDPYLMDVDVAVGGQRTEPLAEYVPDLDPNYEIGETNERILRAMSAAIQAGQKGDAKRSFWSRAFGLYGPAGTGKNTLARQLAASIQTADKDGNVSQGLNYTEYNVLPDSTLEDAIGTVVLEPDGNGGTRSRVKLGKIGLAAAMGSVICINEIARNEKLATALQSILEDGEIIIGSPEAGMTRIPVHPATITCMTWNPGNEGDPDRPAAAPLSRIMPFELPKATAKERAARVGGFLKQFQPADAAPAATDAQRDAEREQLRQTILRKEYKVPQDIQVSDPELEAAVNFVQDIESLAGSGAMDRQIGLNSRTPTRPGDRQLRNYIVLGKTVGWKEAANQFRICCDQNDQFDEQWRLIMERFEAHFGADGNAPSRRAARSNP